MNNVSLMAVANSGQNLLNYLGSIIFVKILLLGNFVEEFSS
jgi:hypothetical protein